MRRLLLLLACTFCVCISYCQTPLLSWAKSIGGTGEDFIQSIHTDDNGNVYIAGSFQGQVDFDPGAGVTTMTASGTSYDAFFARYDNSGNLLGAYQLSGTLNEEIYAITVDGQGNIYIAGYFEGTVDFNPDAVSTGMLTSSGGHDIFFGKFLSNGGLGWVNKFGSVEDDYGYAIALDGTGNVLVTGSFTNTVDFDPLSGVTNRTSKGGSDIFFGKYSNSGSLLWANTMGSTLDDAGRTIDANAANIWLGGYYSGSMDIDPGAAVMEASNLGAEDGFFGQYSAASGSLVWWGTIRSAGSDIVSTLHAGEGQLITAGYFSGSAAIFGANATSQIKESNGGTDIFIAKHSNSTSNLLWFSTVGGTGDDGCDLVTTDASSNVYASGFFQDQVDFDPGAGVSQVSSTGGYDAFITKLTSSGAFAWAGKLGSAGGEEATSVFVDASSNVYVAGIFENTIDADPGNANYPLTSLGEFDGFVVRISQSAPVITSFDPASGTVGTTVTVTGENFSIVPANNIVKFNGTIANVTASTSQSITTSVPSGATTGPVTVTVNNATATSATNFTVSASLATEPTDQPPAPVTFSGITTTGFTATFAPANGDPDGYLWLVKAGDAPTSVPVDGKTYEKGETIGEDIVSWVGEETSISPNAASPATTYHFSIFAYNGSGTSINYRTDSPLRGSVTTLPVTDNDPPAVVDNTPISVKNGGSIQFSVNVSDASPVQAVYLSYGKVEQVSDIYDFQNDSNITTVEMTNASGNTYTHTVNSSQVGNLGVVYVVYAYDESDNGYVSPAPKVIALSVDGNGVTIPYSSPGKTVANYKIISVPLNLEKKTVNDVFGDELDNYGDKNKWRMFRYQSQSTQELSGTSPIEPGKGYWLISSERASLNSGAGTTTISNSNPFSVSVTNGWNQIGNPYPFSILWEDIKDFNPGLSLGDLRVFTGGTEPFSNSQTLKPFEGGFVMVQGSGSLKFPFIQGPSSGREKTTSIKKTNPIDAEDWEVLLEVRNGTATNRFGGFGMNAEAQILNDAFDDFTLPRFLEYLEINHHKEYAGIPITKDIVPLTEDHVWEFVIQSGIPDDLVQIEWDNSYFGANEKQLVLWDVALRVPVDMRKVNRYGFNKKSGGEFRILYGDESFIKENTKGRSTLLHYAFPNPMTDHITFSFSIPELSAQQEVRLEVFDMLGKKISTVLNGKIDPGYHEVTWDGVGDNGMRPAGGVYLTSLTNGNTVDQYRIVIK